MQARKSVSPFVTLLVIVTLQLEGLLPLLAQARTCTNEIVADARGANTRVSRASDARMQMSTLAFIEFHFRKTDRLVGSCGNADGGVLSATRET